MRFPETNTYILVNGDTNATGMFPDGWNHAAYERAVVFVLREIQANAVGSALLNAISDAKAASPSYYLNVRPDFSANRGAHVTCLSAGLREPTVYYTPAHYHLGPRCAQHRMATLVHELTHGLRMLQGGCQAEVEADSSQVRSNGYPNEEEFFAVLVQNVYGGSAGLVLRSGYDLFQTADGTFDHLMRLAGPLPRGMRMTGSDPTIHDYLRAANQANFTPAVLRTFSGHFAGAYRAVIRNLIEQTPRLCNALAALGDDVTPFNPFRDAAAARP